MNLENEVFKRCIFDEKLLIKYGFKEQNGSLCYSKKIIDDKFEINLEYKNKKITGKIMDLLFEEEYTNYRIKDLDEDFVGKVRDEYLSLLTDVKEKCTKSKYFIYDQSNRIAELIKKNMKDNPTFEWESSPGFGCFKNKVTKKWYALIMNVNSSKINLSTNTEVEILNIKLDPKEIVELLQKESYFPAYHMNKKNWITILLNNTISDWEIFELVKKSYLFTVDKK